MRYALLADIHSNLPALKAVLYDVMEEMRREAIPFEEDIPLGAMIEIPSACMTADLLAKEVDFFSIGTNDLIQYTLAVDRVNEHVSYLYEALHPAVLRCMREVVEAGHRAGLRVAVCGEMAGDHAYVLVLLGLGLDEISMNPLSIPRVKKILRMSTVEEARELCKEIFQMSSGAEIERYVRSTMAERFPEVFLEIDGMPMGIAVGHDDDSNATRPISELD